MAGGFACARLVFRRAPKRLTILPVGWSSVCRLLVSRVGIDAPVSLVPEGGRAVSASAVEHTSDDRRACQPCRESMAHPNVVKRHMTGRLTARQWGSLALELAAVSLAHRARRRWRFPGR